MALIYVILAQLTTGASATNLFLRGAHDDVQFGKVLRSNISKESNPTFTHMKILLPCKVAYAWAEQRLSSLYWHWNFQLLYVINTFKPVSTVLILAETLKKKIQILQGRVGSDY